LSEEDAMEIGVKFPVGYAVGYAVDDEDPDGTMEQQKIVGLASVPMGYGPPHSGKIHVDYGSH
jgi:hypothetical protein